MNKKTINGRTVFGAFECVSFPSLKIGDTIAKIDTGAYSGALHCSQIKLTINKSEGYKLLKFTPINDNMEEIQTKDFFVKYVKASNGHSMRRYLIDTDIVINDKRYNIRIGLAKRDGMDKQVLIGRQFLQRNAILVDVNINKQYEKDYKGVL